MTAADNPAPMSLALAVAPFAVMAVLFALGMAYLEPGNGVIVTAMLAAASVAGWIAVRRGGGWDALQEAAGRQLGELFPALILLLLIGGLVGGWMASGTIPFIVAIGLRLVDPNYFILTAFLSTSLMSLVTGTSWGSVSTLGIALMGMAGVLDISLPMAAGAIISGAYFGDKVSPLSDTTIVCSLAVKADLYEHIRHLMYTSIPSWVIAGLLYWQLGSLGTNAAASGSAAAQMLTDIEGSFHWTWLVFAPPAVVLIGIMRRWPAAIGLALSIVVAGIVAVISQGFTVSEAIGAPITGFKLAMLSEGSGAGSDAFAKLVERGGLYSMTEPFVIIIAAVLLTGAMKSSGALDTIVVHLVRAARSTAALIGSTLVAGVVMISLSSHGSVSALILGGLFGDAYRQRGLAAVNLSRSIEDSVTLQDPLLPWTVAGVFMAATLGVDTLAYAPWAFFCLGGPIFSMLYGLFGERLGFGIKKLDPAPA